MNKLVWLTDLHLVEPGRDLPQNVDPLARLRACLDEIGRLHADAARIVLSGDLIQLRNTGAYCILRSELERLPIAFRLLPGNHDDRAALLETFPEITPHDGFLHGAEELDELSILYLDTLAQDGKHHGELCARRLEWIGDRITAAGEKPLLIFLHHPPWEIGVPALDRLRLLDSEPLAELLRQRRAATHLFCGHLHRNVSGLSAGWPFASLKSPHVQFELDMTGSKLARSRESPGYGVILAKGRDIVVNYRDLDLPQAA